MAHFTTNMISRTVINYTNKTVYCVDGRNTYELNPTDQKFASFGYGIYVNSSVSSQGPMSFFGNNGGWELFPVHDGRPTIVYSMGLLIFTNKNHMETEIERFKRNLSMMISSYMSHFDHIMKGSYRVITRLSQAPYYFTTEEGEVFEIPLADEQYRQHYFASHEIDQERLLTEDLLLITTVTHHAEVAKPNVLSVKHWWIPKGIRTVAEPILSYQNGVIVFNDQKSAERYVERYEANFLEYIIVESRLAVEKEYEAGIRQAKEEGKAGRRATVEFITAICVSGLVGVLADRGIDYLLKTGKNKK